MNRSQFKQPEQAQLSQNAPISTTRGKSCQTSMLPKFYLQCIKRFVQIKSCQLFFNRIHLYVILHNIFFSLNEYIPTDYIKLMYNSLIIIQKKRIKMVD